MLPHKSVVDTNSKKYFCILIPFHHREDLLLPLLKHLKQFPVVVVDDGDTKSNWDTWHLIHPQLECVRSTGSSGFTAAVNCGLDRAETIGFRFVLLLNDDAWLDLNDIQTLIQHAHSKRLISPIVETQGVRFYGVKIHSWGWVKLNQNPTDRLDALLGTCLLMPSELRFDSRFRHGFEDLHLTMTAKQSGFELRLVDTALCTHVGCGSLDSNSVEGLRFSMYGHLCLYNSLKRGPIIWSIYILKIVLGDELYIPRIKSIQAINYGVLDWVWSAIAARIASSKAGSNKIK
jgi:GT2 family glycosyltransferase